MIKHTLLIFFSATLQFSILKAQNDAGFIYGKVTTIDENTYTGAIRWGKEEVYWTDFFNATKTKNENLDYVPDDKNLEAKREESWSKKWMKWGHNHYESIHQWVCQFGDIQSLEVTGRSKLILTLKDGTIMPLGGGSNDVGAEIKVYDEELGIVELSWGRIERVEFMKTPNKLNDKFGDALNGTVLTSQGSFSGIVQWDHDERLTTDELDGETDDGDFSIKFGKIANIQNDGDQSIVHLQSGRKLTLEGTNDVDDGNRGIIVTVEGMGRVDIPWEEFKEVTFNHEKNNSGPGYNDFKKPENIRGSVTTKDGQIHSGTIIYDLDEALDIEIIQGMDRELEYLIPIRNIKKIEPKNFEYATITLRNGNSVLIGEGQDVSDRNDGILVFANGNTNPTYVSWEDLKAIELK